MHSLARDNEAQAISLWTVTQFSSIINVMVEQCNMVGNTYLNSRKLIYSEIS